MARPEEKVGKREERPLAQRGSVRGWGWGGGGGRDWDETGCRERWRAPTWPQQARCIQRHQIIAGLVLERVLTALGSSL